MFRQLLFVHWKNVRWVLLPMALAAFGLPLLSIQGFGDAAAAAGLGRFETAFLLETQQVWLPFYPLLALLCGLTIGIAAWMWDHEVDHVYALSLPLPRWEYALLKLGAASLLALIPIGALWAGSLVATMAVTVPAGVQAYPNLLTFRFLLATLLATAAAFALASGTKRTAGIVLGTFFGALFFGEITVDLLGHVIPTLENVSFGELFLEALFEAPGPFQVFTGNWMLVDV